MQNTDSNLLNKVLLYFSYYFTKTLIWFSKQPEIKPKLSYISPSGANYCTLDFYNSTKRQVLTRFVLNEGLGCTFL